jgi:hypothetical protein
VVVVVQFLAADQQAKRAEIGGGVRTVIVAVAPPVAEAIDDACGRTIAPRHSGFS